VSARRGQAVAVVGALFGAALLVISAGRPWGGTAAHAGLSVSSPTGHDRSAVPDVCGLIALPAAALLLALRRVGRILVGAVLVMAGAGALAAVVHVLGYPRPNAWPAVAIAGGLFVAGAGLTAVAFGRRWHGLSERYAAAGARSGPAGRDPELSAWDALDRGEDPTLT